MAMAGSGFVIASLSLTMAMIACGISFFGPYWLANMNNKEPSIGNSTYILDMSATNRGLWAQCGVTCQWFWQYQYQLQNGKFTPLKWHLAAQVLYFIGAAFVLIAEFYARLQLCCGSRAALYRSLGAFVLFASIVQVAALAVFGAGAYKDYGAVAQPTANQPWFTQTGSTTVYFDWCYWMGVAGAALTLIAGLVFSTIGCCRDRK